MNLIDGVYEKVYMKNGAVQSGKGTLLFIFLNFYIINLPIIIAIQFLDGVGDIIDRLWKAGLLLKNDRKYTAV